MSWISLAERTAGLPLILAGPILRRVDAESVTVWVALREPRRVTLRVYPWDAATGRGTARLAGSRQSVRLSDGLHIVAVTARAADASGAVEADRLYCYNLFFQDAYRQGVARDGDAPSLLSPGVLVRDPETASEVERLVYPGMLLPSFASSATTLQRVRIFHGSCRKPHGVGRDALATVDLVLAKSASDLRTRPQQLYLTGDQIYADDVATPLLPVLMDAAQTLVGAEQLPGVPPDMHVMAPGQRTTVVRDVANFTTSTPENHLLTRGEYLAMYLFTWSDVLWPPELPSMEEMWQAYPLTWPADADERQRVEDRWQLEMRELADFRETLPRVRRALANVPTYMVCDDHDVTDDWYLDGAWCARVLGSPLGRRILRNALYAYALCQAWGNDPEQFAGPNGRSFLDVVDRWRGDADNGEDDADAALLTEHLGIPEEFAGGGTLPRTERALRWHYTVETPAYRMHVLDARTRRVYDHPDAAPGLLSEEAMAEQIGDPLPGDTRLTLLVAQTPVLGVDIVEKIQMLSLDHYAYDRESWSLNRRTYQALMRRLARFGRVVILSGDVHYGFGSTMECWEQAADGTSGQGTAQRSAMIVNFTSSACKNAAAGVQKALLTVVYPHLFHLLSQGRMPPVDLLAWNEGTQANADALAAATRAVRRGALAVWWSMPRAATLLRFPSALLLPAHGWPARTFDQAPPARRMRLRYLRDVCKPITPAEPEDESVNPRAALEALRAAHDTHVRETVAALSGEGHVDTEAALEATRVLGSSQHPHPIPVSVTQRLLELARSTFGDGHPLRDRLDASLSHLLHTSIAHPELWASVWSDGDLHIVGDANIGDIRFDEEGQVAVQRLWWYPPDVPGGPHPATEYRASLAPPAQSDEPPLP